MRAVCVVVLFGLACTASAQGLVSILTCEPTGTGELELRLLILNAGMAFEQDGAAVLSLRSADGEVKRLQAPLACAGWAGDHVELVRFEPLPTDGLPDALDVTGTVAGLPEAPLNRSPRFPIIASAQRMPGAAPHGVSRRTRKAAVTTRSAYGCPCGLS